MKTTRWFRLLERIGFASHSVVRVDMSPKDLTEKLKKKIPQTRFAVVDLLTNPMFESRFKIISQCDEQSIIVKLQFERYRDRYSIVPKGRGRLIPDGSGTIVETRIYPVIASFLFSIAVPIFIYWSITWEFESFNRPVTISVLAIAAIVINYFTTRDNVSTLQERLERVLRCL